MELKLTNIVMMDVVGYSSLMEHNKVETLDRLKTVRAGILDPTIARHQGRTVKLKDGVTLAEFSLEFARERLFCLKREDQMNTYISGLKKAGVS